jgi:N-acetylmuramoyl-L-alanine amidase
MGIRGRTILAATAACLLLLLFTAETYPSSNGEAGRSYAVARERLADLKKAPRKRKYRSYWIDCIRTFESVESRFPSTPQAANACFDGASVYLDLYRFNRVSKDAFQASKEFARCQSSYPHHTRAPEALYHIAAVAKSVKRDPGTVVATYRTMAEAYPASPWTEKARRLAGIRSSAKNGSKGRRNREPEIKSPPVAQIEAPKGPPGSVQNVRYWSGGNYTRIVIDQDKPLKFAAFELKKPDRLVFDLLNSRVSDSVDKDPLPVNDGILKQVRTSQYDAETVRVVLDLASLKSYVAFPLHDPERLVIDVTGNQSGDDVESVDTGSAPAVEPSAAATTSTASSDAEQPSVPPKESTEGKDGKLSLSRQLGLKIRTIAIDAGHGGHDPGAIGRGGLKEKNITLDIARRLSALVKDRLGCKVVMTRDNDTFIPLEERPAIAKTKGADLFVSIHVNANRRRRARGIETYLFSLRPSDRDAMATAAFENATSTKTLGQLDTELAKILKGLSSQNKEEESVELAGYVQRSLVNTMRPVKGHIVNLGVKRAFFYVLVNTDMPSILAEVGFISNPEEERLLKKEAYRQKIAEALFEGVKRFVESRGQQVAGL